MTNFERIKSKDLEQMASFMDEMLDGDCDICPMYDACHTEYSGERCEKLLYRWLEQEEETEDLLADNPVR